MNIFYRIVLAIYTVCIIAISILVMVLTVKPSMFLNITESLRLALETRGSAIIIFIAAFLLFGMSLSFLLSGLRNNKDKKAVSKHTNIGEVKISLSTISNIALNVTKRLNGIKETKVDVVKKKNQYISVVIKIIVMPEINIPNLSAEIQGKVKESIQEGTGIEVEEIKVIIENIHTSSSLKARVE